MTNNLFYFILATIPLIISGVFLVKSLSKISRYLHISEFTASFLIMSVTTSMPELFVGISSALNGNPSLSMGNILGANMINLALIGGIFVILNKGINLEKKQEKKDIHLMIFSIVLMIILFLIGNSLSRIDGIILLSVFFFNVYIVYKENRKTGITKRHGITKKHFIKNIIIFIIGGIILFISANYVVKYAKLIAIDFNSPEVLIGIFLVSFATTLPELIFGIQAIIMKHGTMSIGDQIGIIFENITLILAIVAIIHPIEIALNLFLLPAISLLITGILFAKMQKSHNKLSILEGIILIGIYIIFSILILFFNF